ncbi:YdcF family protein [Aquamicrobium zhengzhouense]|uniref:YdcF family protein n=1 Tax=Aquamicrobium zhengzhouense TaxID=2781738 RepID=A0ABS0SAB3_9HYPH|nr:YdcF family protein [Aquamicrobium zhengzhouense]MBI1619403.1 YdcF family protein [Aquamicrobium zhengzhouense]
MFFTLSKLFWIVATPINLIGILIALSIGARLLRFRRLSMICSVAALSILGLGAWTTAGALLLHPLEDYYERPVPPPDNVAGVIVLGGGFEGSVNLARGGYELNASGDRFVEAAILARLYPEAKIVVTGGSGTLLLEGEGDGDTAPRLLTALGVEPERLVLERLSRNTQENATLTRELLNPQRGEVWLLVTSAFHMPRSVGLFRKAGFDVVPWPTDYRTAGTETLGLAQDNVADSLQNLAIGLREWIGLIAYRLTGRIDGIFPPKT